LYLKIQQIEEDTVKSIEAGIKSDLKRVENIATKNAVDISALIERIQNMESELDELKKTNTAFTQRLVDTDSNLQNLKSQKAQDHDIGLSVTVHNVPKLPNESLQDVASKIMAGLGVPVEPGHIAHCRRIKPNQQHNSNAPMIHGKNIPAKMA
jgi:hypothetical protein